MRFATSLSGLRRLILVAGVTATFVLAACGDDAGEGTTTTAASDTGSTAVAEDGDDATTDNVEVATALCEAYGGLETPGAVDDLLALMTDDVVVTDTVLGASLNGTEQVRDYVTSEAFAGIDTSECGAAVARGNWVAGSYTLSNGETGAGGAGIAAVHVTGGKVDQQVIYYTQLDADAPAPSTATVADAVAVDYCQAWDDGVDADAVLSFMTAEPELQVVTPIVGTEAIRSFLETDFDFDRNDCGDEAVVHGEWQALDNRFENTTSGAVLEGVNVVRIDEDGLVALHVPHLEPAD